MRNPSCDPPPLRRRRSRLVVTDAIATLMVAVVVDVVGLGQSSFPALSQETGDRPPVGMDRTGVAPSREPNVTASHDEIAALLKRGQELMRNGDIAAARLVLRRAAEAKSAEAALTLGATYDPVILRELRVYGFSGDVGMARTWYEKAKEFGSPEAARRLDILAR
jgi:TPR repeat protein